MMLSKETCPLFLIHQLICEGIDSALSRWLSDTSVHNNVCKLPTTVLHLDLYQPSNLLLVYGKHKAESVVPISQGTVLSAVTVLKSKPKPRF